MYIDSNVFVYHLIQHEHKLEKNCQRFLRQIAGGLYVGVVNTFVTAEILGAANLLESKKQKQHLSIQDLARVQERVERAFARLGLEVHDADGLSALPGFPPLFERSNHLVLNSPAVHTGNNSWKSAGGADGVHIGLAERSGVSHLATCDQGMKMASSNVTPVILQEEYP